MGNAPLVLAAAAIFGGCASQQSEQPDLANGGVGLDGSTGIPVVEATSYAASDVAELCGQAPEDMGVTDETTSVIDSYNAQSWDYMWQGADPDSGTKVALVSYGETGDLWTGGPFTQVTMLYNDGAEYLQGISTTDFYGPTVLPQTLKCVGVVNPDPGITMELDSYLLGDEGANIPVENVAGHLTSFVTGTDDRNPQYAVIATTEYAEDSTDLDVGSMNYWLRDGSGASAYGYANVADSEELADYQAALAARVSALNAFGYYAVSIDADEDGERDAEKDPNSDNVWQVIVKLD